MLDLQPRTDGFKVSRRVRATTVGDEVHRSAIPEARRIEHHERHPSGFGRSDHPREDGP